MKILKSAMCILIALSLMLLASACGGKNFETETEATTVSEKSDNFSVVGKGEKQFYFTVTDLNGNEENFEVHTNKTTVGDALEELNLISGEKGQYGIYVKKVNGISADYEKDGTYWAFYVNGEYALKGADMTEIVSNASYSFKVENGK